MTQRFANSAQAMRNGQPVRLADIPNVEDRLFRKQLIEACEHGGRVMALFGHPEGYGLRLIGVVGFPERGAIQVTSTRVGDRFPALTPDLPQVHLFERELAEQWGVVPEGHPWFKPVRYHHSYRAGKDAWGRSQKARILPCVTEHYRLLGPEIHQVAVGPVHAGVIEPGSFRFQCHGEMVYHLEIHLGYQHRGLERKLNGGPNKRTFHYMETAAGDSSVAHATAYAQILEGLADVQVPLRAQMIRGIGLELERLAAHTGDLGALADDIGFLPTQAFAGRLRGEFLNSTGTICGNRMGRSLVRPGGVGWDIDKERGEALSKRLRTALSEVKSGIDLLWTTPTVEARFEDCGSVSEANCRALGLVGMAARACGVEEDARRDFPTGIYRFSHVPVATWHTGDVMARALVRAFEIDHSGDFILDQLESMPESPLTAEVGSLAANALVVSLCEGWRGEICHVAITGDDGKFKQYKIYDPSFHNWTGLSMALRSLAISDFPLNNKSFNLSYCGHDL